jgi:chromosomal replication initiation ATPase DnaA
MAGMVMQTITHTCPESVLENTAAYFDITTDVLLDHRWPQYAQARHTAVWMLRNICTLPVREIGLIVNRDPTTIRTILKQFRPAVETMLAIWQP